VKRSTSKSRKAGSRKAGSGSPRSSSRRAASRSGGSRGRRVYFFGDGRSEGRAHMKDLLGGKGANLAEMTWLGVPVPPGFTISTEVCAEFNAAGRKLAPALKKDVMKAMARVERIMGRRFGDAGNPLLVSVRSGARASMPGMMDTVLNLGLNDESVQGLAAHADERFAYDSYRRFVSMYADVVLGVEMESFKNRLEAMKDERGYELDTELGADELKALVGEYLEVVREHTGAPFPQDPMDQLWGAVAAVFHSWENPRARTYRRLHGIPASWGTAVNVQAMVFGNKGDDCATGVAFSRNPSTGERAFFGEYLKNAQGEDVVAGIRTPQPINKANRRPDQKRLPTLEEEMPRAYRELERIYRKLEKHYRDMQDIEFTIEHGRLWMLQCRVGKRTVRAAVKIAVDMVKERLITREEAVLRIEPRALDQLLHPTLDPNAERDVMGRGLPASPGAAVGTVVLTADEAEARAKAGEKVILVRAETSPEDIHGMHAAEGILTARGGLTSHAAVVARGMGKCCVAGCGALRIDVARGEVHMDEHVVKAGDPITIDGSTGEVMRGRVPTVTPELGGEFGELMKWADGFRELQVRTNADSPHDAKIARQFGAEGIGLCRTEHMFFEPNRILAVREMILAADQGEREGALEKLLPMQRGDFVGLFQAMEGLPVTIRLLDPPLHEFLPNDDDGIREMAEELGTDVAKVRAMVDALREFNPMLGHRGCRLGVTFPEIYRMQVRAIVEAAREVAESGVRVQPEIMIPLVSHVGELKRLRELAEAEVKRVLADAPKLRIKPTIGTMIEVPRAALTADSIAGYADFFSFGTNDLTQMTYALSRDDAGRFLDTYMDTGILEDDPFVSIDEDGIGTLVRIGVEKGRSTTPSLKVGICGEHGGDPKSVKFCARSGLDYVSCSPYRVPVARLAAAQAAVEARAARPERRARKAGKAGAGSRKTGRTKSGARKAGRRS